MSSYSAEMRFCFNCAKAPATWTGIGGSAAAGHVEPGETAIGEALHEAAEELGISLDTDQL
ncbi:hypothetical protein [Glutamicibacter mishrai]|uniref:hypothetical protein n=1 Tax=Glutamicibacter mishrai TaxID=1775880 RepID=UPI003F7AF58B